MKPGWVESLGVSHSSLSFRDQGRFPGSLALTGTLGTAHHNGCWPAFLFLPQLVLSVSEMAKEAYRAVLAVCSRDLTLQGLTV